MGKRLKTLRSYLSPRRRKKKEEEKPMFTVMPAYPPQFMGGYPPQTPIQYVMQQPSSSGSMSEMEVFQKWQKFLGELDKEKKEKEKKPDAKKGPELNANAIFMWMVILLPFVAPLSWYFTAWAFSSGVQMVVEASKMLPK